VIERVGIDLVEVARIAQAARRPGFLNRILTPSERALDLSTARIAGRWAAKEAIAKAVGLHLTWQDVEILPAPNGEPIVTVHHPDFDPQAHRIHLSITHERGHAAAVAVLEKVT
jgi:holo-[acyl-carrier protein] synthase